jgi:hypothetical protein
MSDNNPLVGGVRRNIFKDDCAILFFILVFLLLFADNRY